MNAPNAHFDGESTIAQAPNRSSLLVLTLLAYSVYEHGYEGGTASTIELRLDPRSCVLRDNGRGTGLHRAGYVSGLVEQLTDRQSKVALHGLGLAVIAMSCPRMTIEACRDGRVMKQEFSWGVALGGVSESKSEGAGGTRIAFDLADGEPDIDISEVKPQAAHWMKAHPGLKIEVFFTGEQVL